MATCHVLGCALVIAGGLTLQAQRPDPPPIGRRVHVQDGDLIVVEHGARIRILHRREAVARVIADPKGAYILILADFSGPSGEPPDGRVDKTYSMTGLSGRWPFDARWEGPATIEEYGTIDYQGQRGLGIAIPAGSVQFLGSADSSFRDPSAVASIQFTGMGSGGGDGGQSFDAAEGQQLATRLQNVRSLVQSHSGSAAPVRVGGNVSPPVKRHHVDPVYPEIAREAKIRGVVIIELTIGEDGRVRDAKVLRSIPLLDQAALEAVRQWRFEPTLLGGRAVPVILTATVSFSQ